MTLIEMLVVVGIIAILTALIVPAANQALRGSTLTQSGDELVNLLTLARQSALASNGTVEVRFYQYGDPSIPGESAANPSSWRFQAIQAFAVNDAGLCSPVGKVEGMFGSVIMDSGNGLSPILSGSFARVWSAAVPKVPIPRANTSYQCCAFRFFADGSTNLPTTGGPWFITLHNRTDGDGLAATNVGPTAKIKNFVTVEIDPTSGSLTTYRP